MIKYLICLQMLDPQGYLPRMRLNSLFIIRDSLILKTSFFFVKGLNKTFKYLIKGRRLNLFLGSLYLNSFKSSLQFHPFETLYIPVVGLKYGCCSMIKITATNHIFRNLLKMYFKIRKFSFILSITVEHFDLCKENHYFTMPTPFIRERAELFIKVDGGHYKHSVHKVNI